MKIEVPVSIGELFDKLSILQIKKEKITDKKMLDLISEELSLLSKSISLIIDNNKGRENEIFLLMDKLKLINQELWDIEENKRDCERKKIFDDNFIELSRSVYKKNDKRAELKKEINLKFESKIVEVKSHEKY